MIGSLNALSLSVLCMFNDICFGTIGWIVLNEIKGKEQCQFR